MLSPRGVRAPVIFTRADQRYRASMRTRRVVLPLIALATALTVASPVAQADKSSDLSSGPALKTTTAAFVDDISGDFQVATVACPAGQKVLAGGYSGADGDFATANRALDDHTWVVKGSFSLSSTAFAYCSAGLTVEPASTTAHIPGYSTTSGGNNSRAVSAKCPRGTRVVSGGWEWAPYAGNSPVYTSKPHHRRSWIVSGVYDGEVDFDFTTYAYCMRGVDAVTVSAPVVIDDTATATATCATGRLIGGGFDTTPAPDFYNTTGPDTFGYTASRASRKSWTVSARNYSSFNTGSIVAIARCYSKRH